MKFKVPLNMAVSVGGHRYVGKGGVLEVEDDVGLLVKDQYGFTEIKKNKKDLKEDMEDG